jgi:hypothetical protein
MTRSTLTLWLLLSCSVACSREFFSPGVGVRYEPPSGMAFVAEESGAAMVARFEGGLEVISVPGPAPRPDEEPVNVLRAGGLATPGQRLLNTTQGTLPAGTVTRYEFQQGATRTLVYLIPRDDRFVLVVYSAPEQDYGPGLARVERSLSTLKLTR